MWVHMDCDVFIVLWCVVLLSIVVVLRAVYVINATCETLVEVQRKDNK